jgi:hypothetical protein
VQLLELNKEITDMLEEITIKRVTEFLNDYDPLCKCTRRRKKSWAKSAGNVL